MRFPYDLAVIIAGYAVPMRIASWVDPEMIKQENLLANPNAIGADIDARFGGNIDLDDVRWDNLDLTLLNPNDAVGKWFMKHSKIVNLRQYMHCIARNPSSWAGLLVKQWIARLRSQGENWGIQMDWDALSANPAPWAVSIMKKNPSKTTRTICSNPSEYAIMRMKRVIEEDGDDTYIDHNELNRNPHPWAIQRVDMAGSRNESLSSTNPNPDLIEFIRASAIAGLTNPDGLATNPNIFEQDTDEIARVRDILNL